MTCSAQTDVSQEAWKPIPDWPQYEASNLGRIRHAKSKHIRAPRRNIARGGKVYLRITLGSRRCHTDKSYLVHRLILLAWVGPPPIEKGRGAHLNDDGVDNRLVNLKWVDDVTNTVHKTYTPCQCGREYDEHNEDGQPATPGVECSGYKSAKEVSIAARP